MKSLRILDAAVERDRHEWLSLWESWPGREVSAHPDYVRLFTRPGDRAIAATMVDDKGAVLFPLILRSVASEPQREGRGTASADLTSPYGYGGPFAWGIRDDESVASEFWASFNEWARDVGAVSLFVRLSLFPHQMIGFDGNISERTPNVVRELGMTPEAMLMDYKSSVRRSIRAAQRAGLMVEVDATGRRLSDFLTVYHATMDRHSADDFYYFPEQFFRDMMANLPGRFVFFHAMHEGKTISSVLMLLSNDYAYQFLSGTLTDAFRLRPVPLLKHSAYVWLAREGKKACVLGGGYSGKDSLFEFKLSLAPHGVVPFKTGAIIYDVPRYEELVSARRQWEAAQGNDWQPRPDYFPAYRSPNANTLGATAPVPEKC